MLLRSGAVILSSKLPRAGHAASEAYVDDPYNRSCFGLSWWAVLLAGSVLCSTEWVAYGTSALAAMSRGAPGRNQPRPVGI